MGQKHFLITHFQPWEKKAKLSLPLVFYHNFLEADLFKHHWRVLMTSVSVTNLSSSDSALCIGMGLIQVLGQYLLLREAGMKERE